MPDVSIGHGLLAHPLFTVVGDDGPVSEPMRKVDNGTADVAGTDHEDGVGWHVGLQVYLHFATADAGIAFGGLQQ